MTRVARYDRRNLPLVGIFGPAGQAHLNLITCAGSNVPSNGGYQDRLVVFTTLVAVTNASAL